MERRPYLLSIGGFDPCGGAGIIADIKTFEAHRCYGMSVCTAVTVQNDIAFTACHWISVKTILAQLEITINRFDVTVVKIGIVENKFVLEEIIAMLKKGNKHVKIVLDPVLKSGSGYRFHTPGNQYISDDILENIYLLCPNYEEFKKLYPDKNEEERIAHITNRTNLLLKGGHRSKDKGTDYLYTTVGDSVSLKASAIHPEKHGSGCVLVAAVAANLAFQMPLNVSCEKAKRYTEHFLASTNTLLGHHK